MDTTYTLREITINRLAVIIKDSNGYGIPRYFDCSDEEYIKDPAQLAALTDDELLNCYEATFMFSG